MLTTQVLTAMTGGLAAYQTTLVRAINPRNVAARPGLYVIGRGGSPRYVGESGNLSRRLITYYRLAKILDARPHEVAVWYIYGFPVLRDRRTAETQLSAQLNQWLRQRGRRGLFNARSSPQREYELEW